MKLLRLIGVAIGGALVGYLIHQVGLRSIRESLSLLGWAYIIVLAYPVTWIGLNTLGWAFACRQLPKTLSFLQLVAIRLAGETFNSLLPSGYVGGEPLKAKLLSRWMPLSEAASSVLVAKSAQSLALVAFVGLGLTVAAPSAHSPLHDSATLTALVLLSTGIVVFTLLLASRSFSRLSRWAHRVTRHPWFAAQTEHLQTLDEALGAVYQQGKRRVFFSVLAHLGGWIAGSLEVALIFLFLGHPIPWHAAWFIGAMAQLAAIIGLLVPAGIGLYEGGHYVAAGILGLPPSLGLSVSLIRRVREVFWDAVGVAVFAKMTRRKN